MSKKDIHFFGCHQSKLVIRYLLHLVAANFNQKLATTVFTEYEESPVTHQEVVSGDQ